MNCWSTFKTLILCQLSDNRSFQSYLKPGSLHVSRQLSELTTVAFRATKILPAIGVNIPADCSFQSCQNTVNFKSWNSFSFQSYLTPGRRYASLQLSELTSVTFRANKNLSTVGADILVDCSFQSNPKLCQQWELILLSTVVFRAAKILSTLRADIPVVFRAT